MPFALASVNRLCCCFCFVLLLVLLLLFSHGEKEICQLTSLTECIYLSLTPEGGGGSGGTAGIIATATSLLPKCQNLAQCRNVNTSVVNIHKCFGFFSYSLIFFIESVLIILLVHSSKMRFVLFFCCWHDVCLYFAENSEVCLFSSFFHTYRFY